ncbi:GDP-mannose 4,6-dehydratase [Elusimicrobiota bacterium]
MNWRGKKVAITGAGGFIGSHLARTLVDAGADVRALVHYNSRNHWGHLEELPHEVLSDVEIVSGDVTDAFSMERFVAGREYVFHLAALIGIPFSYIAPQLYVQVNIQGTLNILEACRKHGVEKLVHTSTSETYGTATYTPIDEKHPLQGQSPYSASKIAADKLAESYYRSFGLPVAVARPFNTYGPHQSARAVIPTIITQSIQGGKIKLGNLTPIRDFNYVADTINAFLLIAASSHTVGQVLNICSGAGITIDKLAQKILRLLDMDVPIEDDGERQRPDNSEVFRLEGNAGLLMKLTDWKPGYSLNDGLRLTIEYIKENMKSYKPTLYNV